MPVVLLDRLPLPNLRVYTAASVLALSACVYFAQQTVTKGPPHDEMDRGNATQDVVSVGQKLGLMFAVMIREPMCVWTMINMALCWLVLIGSGVQKLVFGELRVSEQQHLKDKFWNFVFYKFIFIFGVINVQYIDEVLLWCSWFSLLGFLHLLSQLGKDRFEYLSFSPTTPIWSHVKLLLLLSCIFVLSGFMLLVSLFVGFYGGFNTFAFMSVEVVLLSIRTLHVIIRYGFHLYDMRQEGANAISASDTNKMWEKRSAIAYYIELIFELAALTIDFVHHLHMLLWSNIFLSMASLVICMQLRFLFHEIQRRYKKHRNYLWVRNHLEQNYPMASAEELTKNSDNCAICWEKMEAARKLPCEHLFHNTCLQSWLEQDTSCPTCRLALNIQNPVTTRLDPSELLQMDPPQNARRQLNHFFHFDGSRYVSWLPSFSVEVSHAQLLRTNHNAASNSQLDAMARQVQQLFPHFPISHIIEDLRLTRSVELTIENVLDGRLVGPAMFREPEVLQTTTNNLPQENIPETSEASQNWEDLSTDYNNCDVEELNLGGRFSKSSTEREKILHRRKETMIQKARKRYIEKQKQKSGLVQLQQKS